MTKRLLLKVHTRDEYGDFGPDYAMVRYAPSVRSVSLREAMSATMELAVRFGRSDEPIRQGALFGVEWDLSDMPLDVTWLRGTALYHHDGATDEDQDPPFLQELEDKNWVVLPDDWHPNMGVPDQGWFGDPENGFTAVELAIVRTFAGGLMEIQANVDSTPLQFVTEVFVMGLLLGDEEVEVGDTVYVTDEDPKDNFEGEVVEVLNRGGLGAEGYVVDGGPYGRQTYTMASLQILCKHDESEEECA
jgi:hypothetical protein